MQASKIVIWKAQGVPQYNNIAFPKHQEDGENPLDKNHKTTLNNSRKTSSLPQPRSTLPNERLL